MANTVSTHWVQTGIKSNFKALHLKDRTRLRRCQVSANTASWTPLAITFEDTSRGRKEDST